MAGLQIRRKQSEQPKSRGDTSDQDFVPTTTNLEQIATVINNSGTELPSTGGIGTTIFYIVGAILVIGAGVLLVTRRRMNTK